MKSRSLLAAAVVAALLCALVWRISRGASPLARAAPEAGTIETKPAPEPLEGTPFTSANEPMESERVPAPIGVAPTPEPKAVARGTAWHARVLDADSGEPVVGATLTLGAEPRGKEKESVPLKSGDDGRFSPVFVRVRAGGRFAVVEHAGHARVFVALAAGHESLESECVIRLTHSATLDVHVHDVRGQGREGAIVRVSASSFDLVPSDEQDDALFLFMEMPAEVSWSGLTDVSGHCQLDGIPPHCSLAVDLLAGDQVLKRYPGALRLEPSERRTIDWAAWLLGSGCQVAGAVVEADGRPAADLEVWLASYGRTGGNLDPGSRDELEATSRTDAQGLFLFEDLAPSQWWVTVAPGQAGIASTGVLAEIAPDEARKEITLRIERELYIRGLVLGPDDRPVEGCTIQGWCKERDFQCEAESDPDGRFALGPLLAGRYRLETEVFRAPGNVTSAPPLEAKSGDAAVEIHLPSAGTLVGHVVRRATGKPVTASVWLCPSPSVPSKFGQEYETQWDGKFEFTNLEIGTYQLMASTKSGDVCVPSPVVIVAGTNQAGNLVVDPGARLVLELPGRDSYVLVELSSGAAVLGREWLDAGATIQMAAPPGAALCRVYDDSDDSGDAPILVQELPLTFVAGETKRVELRPLPPR